MGYIRKEIAIGFFVAVAVTCCGGFLYITYFSELTFEASLQKIHQEQLHAPALALASLPNLGVFFIYLKKKQDYRARGVLMAAIFIALITFVFKLI